MPIACAIRAARLYLPSSQKFLVAISVTMYHPLNGAAEYLNPPKSRVMFETAGTPYHRKPSYEIPRIVGW